MHTHETPQILTGMKNFYLKRTQIIIFYYEITCIIYVPLCCSSWWQRMVDLTLCVGTGDGPRLRCKWDSLLAKLWAHTCEGIMRKYSIPTICFRAELTCW